MERLKGKYEKLYQMVLKIFESERTLLGKARALNKEEPDLLTLPQRFHAPPIMAPLQQQGS